MNAAPQRLFLGQFKRLQTSRQPTRSAKCLSQFFAPSFWGEKFKLPFLMTFAHLVPPLSFPRAPHSPPAVKTVTPTQLTSNCVISSNCRPNLCRAQLKKATITLVLVIRTIMQIVIKQLSGGQIRHPSCLFCGSLCSWRRNDGIPFFRPRGVSPYRAGLHRAPPIIPLSPQPPPRPCAPPAPNNTYPRFNQRSKPNRRQAAHNKSVLGSSSPVNARYPLFYLRAPPGNWRRAPPSGQARPAKWLKTNGACKIQPHCMHMRHMTC